MKQPVPPIRLYEIFDAILKKPVIVDELKKRLDKAAGK